MEALGLQLRAEAVLETLTEKVTKSSDIEGDPPYRHVDLPIPTNDLEGGFAALPIMDKTELMANFAGVQPRWLCERRSTG